MLVMPGVALAHERRDVAGYQFVVGFFTEPAIEGISNAASLRVSKPGGAEATPVEGLEETLELEITHVETAVSRTFALRARFNDPGHYVADLIPTAPGQYRFRFFGTIEGAAVDETFESGPETFSDIAAASELQFPVMVAEPRELESAVRGATEASTDADDAASSARTLALTGVVLGAVGIVTGVGGALWARRRT